MQQDSSPKLMAVRVFHDAFDVDCYQRADISYFGSMNGGIGPGIGNKIGRCWKPDASAAINTWDPRMLVAIREKDGIEISLNPRGSSI